MAAVREALAAGASPDSMDARQRTALMWAAQRGDRAMVDLLLSAGARPTAVDRNGLTAADHARATGHTELANRLAAPVAMPPGGPLR
jgi:ankyrin repeat protein